MSVRGALVVSFDVTLVHCWERVFIQHKICTQRAKHDLDDLMILPIMAAGIKSRKALIKLGT